MKLFIPLALALSVAACSSSSDSDSAPDDPVMQDESNSDETDEENGDGEENDESNDGENSDGTDEENDESNDGENSDGIDEGNDESSDGENSDSIDEENDESNELENPDDSQLEAASRIENIGTYTTLIEIVSSLEVDGEFTNDNYQEALFAIGESSQSSLVFQRARFLALLETQVQDGTSDLDFLNITEGSFNRVHICPDGGRLLAVKDNDTVPGNLTGNYRFEDCAIGDIFIDGDYASSESLFTTARLDVRHSYSAFRMIGVDSVETTLSGAYGHIIRSTDNNTGGEILTTDSTESMTASIGIDGVGVLDIFRLLSNAESVEAESVDVEVPLIATSRGIRLNQFRLSVENDVNVNLTASTTTDFAESPEGTTFEQGEMALALTGSPNRLRLQAANGDPASFDAFILQEDNSVVSFTVPWTDSDLDFGSLERLPAVTAPR